MSKMTDPDFDLCTSNGLREVRQWNLDTGEIVSSNDMAVCLAWAADEIDRLNAIIQSSESKTYAISETTAADMRVRSRVYGIIAWHVNREHAHFTDHELAQAAFDGYCKHWGRQLIDPNE